MNMNEEEKKPCEQCEEYLAGWKRALADYDNLQKGLVGERANIRASMKEDMAKYLVEVIDSLKNILEGRGDPLQGVESTKRQFDSALERFDIKPIETTSHFNPHIHEAVAQRSEESMEDQAILEVVQTGWKVGEKVIRPAKVIINTLNEKK
jgi:molecular chaperone GrpE